MVINKFGDRLYNGLVTTITEHLQKVAKTVEAAQGESFLKELKLRWDHSNKSMQMIRDILMVSSGCWHVGVGSEGKPPVQAATLPFASLFEPDPPKQNWDLSSSAQVGLSCV